MTKTTTAALIALAITVPALSTASPMLRPAPQQVLDLAYAIDRAIDPLAGIALDCVAAMEAFGDEKGQDSLSCQGTVSLRATLSDALSRLTRWVENHPLETLGLPSGARLRDRFEAALEPLNRWERSR